MWRHWNVEPACVEVNLNVAVLSLVGDGGLAVIVVSGGVTSSATSIDRSTLSRPPVETRLANAAFLSTPLRSAFLSFATVRLGAAARIRAAAPATCGDAMDVPAIAS